MAHFLNHDKCALACDFAQYYGIYDWRAVPVSAAACFAAGLPEDSRSKLALAGQTYGLKTLLLAAIADRLSVLIWQGTKDAQKGKNKPVMIIDTLIATSRKADKLLTFATPTDFETARQRLQKKG